jgi:LacI family transcriptional regulator
LPVPTAVGLYRVLPLTTVHHPIQELGELAARTMLRLLAEERPQVDVPTPRLIVRESTSAAAQASPH